ncbi:MAG: GIY-YIG nuclease family protein [Microbacterium sp.]|uniref:GIY-YIG nuclease family protein n=1 Tax=Microbacterium sp. TaxID=51671 RepID=UPI001DD8EC31|nr:GIY-YIG nuclease family protein [Microbacterium sp.]MBW8764603.1 GIY-YIG nuclease family protein [Microbacterium sp.]
MRCCIPGCDAAAAPDAPLPLCETHLAVAADWAARTEGVTDLLPSPCLACGSRIGVRFPSGWTCAVCEWRYGDVPDDDAAPPRVDVVYYLRNGGRVKIGTTANPRQRFAAIWHEEVMAFERGDRRLERARHEQFAADRLGGSEWFRLTPAIAEQADAIAAGRDPWDVYARWMSEAAALASGQPNRSRR